MENKNNFGFGNQGNNQYSDPYNNDLNSKPSIERRAQRVADQYKGNPQNYSNSDAFLPIASNKIDNQEDIVNYNNSTNYLDTDYSSSKKKMDNSEKKNSKAFLLNNDSQKIININEDEEKSMKPPRKHSVCCMCCPLWVCLSVTVFLLATIGILAFIFWPKIPEINISSIVLSEPKDDSPSIRYQIPSAENDNKGGVEIDLDIHVTVKNDNFYNLNIHSLKTRVFLQNESAKTLVGTGNAEDLTFPSHDTTEFVLPLTIGYYINDYLKDSALIALLKACETQTPIKIQYEVDIGIFPVELVYTPTYKGDQSFSCPVNNMGDMAGGLSSILSSDIYSSISQYLSQFLGE